MAASNRVMAHKLQTAINQNFGERILIDKTQWYSDKQKRPITTYRVLKSYPPEEGKKHGKREKLFDSTSMIQLVLYLRDYWYWLNGWEIPTDNETWNAVKQQRGIAFESGNAKADAEERDGSQ